MQRIKRIVISTLQKNPYKTLTLLTKTSNRISHKGIIDAIEAEEGMVHVRIVQHSACSSCKVAMHCASSESKEKIIDVRCADTSRYSIGQEVNVMAAQGVGFKAVLIAFCIPAILILATVAIALLCGASEAMAALLALCTLPIYFGVAWMSRSKLEKVLRFWIEET